MVLGQSVRYSRLRYNFAGNVRSLQNVRYSLLQSFRDRMFVLAMFVTISAGFVTTAS